jgi:hypothetical protein
LEGAVLEAPLLILVKFHSCLAESLFSSYIWFVIWDRMCVFGHSLDFVQT